MEHNQVIRKLIEAETILPEGAEPLHTAASCVSFRDDGSIVLEHDEGNESQYAYLTFKVLSSPMGSLEPARYMLENIYARDAIIDVCPDYWFEGIIISGEELLKGFSDFVRTGEEAQR